jgi:glycosyltransferase involved in cell wall biosynthesis
MHIALDGRTIQDHFPGIGRYTFNLARALAETGPADDILLLHNQRDPNTRFDLDVLRAWPNLSILESYSPYFSLVEQWRIPRHLRTHQSALYHSPYYLMPYRAPCPAVVTVHDLIPLLYPHYFTPFQRLVFNLAVRLATRAARMVVADSEAAAADLRRLLHLDSRKVRVVLAAADPTLVRPDDAAVADARSHYGLPKSYVLYVGSNKPHKNLTRLVEAWSLVRRRGQTQLVIAGAWDPAYNAPQIAAAHLRLENDIRWLGPIPQSDLAALYSGSAMFVFPSEYEGFGLPVLEAMACGVPVICSNRSSLPEVAGDAAILVDPHASEAWAEAIERLLEDDNLRAAYAQRSLHHAQQFTWAETARQMRALYAHALELW